MFRFYCTIDDLRPVAEHGFKYVSDALDAIKQASIFLEGEYQLDGNFIPITDTRSFDGDGSLDLYLRDPLLSITSITLDTTTLATSDYLLYPLNKCWQNGPYTRIHVDPDASNLYEWTDERDIVSIVGTYGKFDNYTDTGEDITQAAAATATITVTNGANVVIGMILLIESEQEAVTGYGDATSATSLVDGAIAKGDTNITVDDASEFNIGELIKIGTEKMRINDIDTGNENLYVDRSYDGTRLQAHNDDSAISVYRTYTVERGVNGTTAAAHSSKSAYQYLPPYDVRYLCKQIASLMIEKGRSRYAGKTGNVDLGEVFYMNEFPKNEIEQVRKNYFTRSMT